MMSEQIKTLTRMRAVRQGLITQDFKVLDRLREEEYNVHLLDQCVYSIESNLALVEECDTSICEGMQDAVSDAEVETALESTRTYRFTVSEKLAKLKLKREELSKAQILPSPPVVKLPLLKIT